MLTEDEPMDSCKDAGNLLPLFDVFPLRGGSHKPAKRCRKAEGPALMDGPSCLRQLFSGFCPGCRVSISW